MLLGAGGFKKQIAGFNVERIGNAARSLAFGRYAFNVAREHVATRKQFGRPLCEFQGLQWKFADMEIKLEGGATAALPRRRQRGPRLPVGGRDRDRQGGLQPGRLRGGARGACRRWARLGYSRETLVEYCMRRCRGWMIAGGSIEILKNRIAEDIFDRRFDQRGRRADAAE